MGMPEDDRPDTLVDEFRRTDDGYVIRIKVLVVPESDKFPDGITYRMHFGTTEGNTLLRYDNSHGVHERHSSDGVEEIDFPGVEALYARFRTEIDSKGTENEQ